MAYHKSRVNEAYWNINRDCDYISLHTNRENRKCVNDIRKNLMSIYAEMRDLRFENLKLHESQEKLRREFYSKTAHKREQIISLSGNPETCDYYYKKEG